MFFRRQKAHVPTFQERLARLKELGFRIEGSGSNVRGVRRGCAADILDRGDQLPEVGQTGILIGSEIGLLVDRGFQKVFRTPGGQELPALAHHLRLLHSFQEDLKEGLGLKSLYNESLGTVNDLHLYDRVTGRDAEPRPKPWERR
jgi:hypothetical protein